VHCTRFCARLAYCLAGVVRPSVVRPSVVRPSALALRYCSAECLGMPLTATPATHHRTVKQIIPLCLQHKIRLCLQHSIPLRQRAPCYLSWHIAVRYVAALCVCDMCLRLTIACYLCMCVVLCGWWLFGTSPLCARTHVIS